MFVLLFSRIDAPGHTAFNDLFILSVSRGKVDGQFGILAKWERLKVDGIVPCPRSRQVRGDSRSRFMLMLAILFILFNYVEGYTGERQTMYRRQNSRCPADAYICVSCTTAKAVPFRIKSK